MDNPSGGINVVWIKKFQRSMILHGEVKKKEEK